MFIQRLRLRNILSFADCSIDLRKLNVVIGPNGSGKSNLTHIVALLANLPGDFASYVVNSRGADLWLRLSNGVESAVVDVDFEARDNNWTYSLSFGAVGPVPYIQSEQYRSGDEVILRREPGTVQRNGSGGTVPLRLDYMNQTTLGMFRGPEESSIIPDLARFVEKFRVYRDFDTGDRSALRNGLSTVRSYGRFLTVDGSNLAEILQDLDHAGLMPLLNKRLLELNADAINIRQEVRDGRWILTMEERSLARRVPAAVLSDGTLRFLCLAAILMNPNPPPLVCIEEPEAGLHPDAIRIVAGMLVEASSKTQLIVTTHSRELIDCFTSEPETVLVCEKGFDNETTLRRADPEQLTSWLETYTLGDVWMRGALGGTRW